MENPYQQHVLGFLVGSDGVQDSENEHEPTRTYVHNDPSNLIQCDGADSVGTNSDDVSTSDYDVITEYESEDEVDAQPEPVVLVPEPGQPGQPPVLQIDPSGRFSLPASLPLGIVCNARSLFNKIDNFRRLLREIGPDYAIVSETFDWEGRRVSLEQLLHGSNYGVKSYRRPRRQNGTVHQGGGCAIVYNETRFKVEDLEIQNEEGIESVFAIFTPNNFDHHLQKLKRICIGSVYIPPRSKYKQDTIDQIIQVIHYTRAKYDNEVAFTVAGDFNRTDYTDILESYGALQQCVEVGTRQASADNATLDVILSDLHTHYHPPTTKEPLEVDDNKEGENSDHDIVIFAPKSDPNFAVKRKKKVVTTRPIPDSQIPAFGRDIQSQSWIEVLEEPDLELKVTNFHHIITSVRNRHFKQRRVTISNLDKKWMTPELKTLLRKVQREILQNRKSRKWRKLKFEFKQKKRKTIKAFHSKFVSDLKSSNPRQFYQMAKRIGAVDQMNTGKLSVKCLAGLSDCASAEAVGQSFAAVSAEQSPLDRTQLPAYLPSLPRPR